MNNQLLVVPKVDLPLALVSIEDDLENIDELEKQIVEIKCRLAKNGEEHKAALLGKYHVIDREYRKIEKVIENLRKRKEKLRNQHVRLWKDLRKLGWSPIKG